MIIAREIIENANQQPAKTAIIHNGKKYSYQWLGERVIATACYLKEQGCRKGDRVMFGAVKSPEFALMYFGAHTIGAVAVPVDLKLNYDKLSYIHGQSQPKVFWYPTPKMVKDLEARQFDYDEIEKFIPADLSRFTVEAEQEETADLLFTTGTTGNPKGVELSHLSITAGAINTNEFIGNSQNDREIIPLPLFHAFGLRRLRTNMLLGASVVLVDGFMRPDLIFEGFEKWEATGICMVPAGYALLKKLTSDKIGQYKDQLKYIEFGSSPMKEEEKHHICELLPNTRICMHYGLTEAAANIFIEFHDSRDKLHSLGKASPNMQIRIGDEQGNPLDTRQEGEILVKGDVLMKGYWNDEERTRRTFVQGWLRTGDVGYKDEQGYVFLKGRKDDIINIGGKKVAPQEVEKALNALAEVEEAACISVDDPGGIRGKVIKAFVVVKKGYQPDFNELKNQLRNELEPYKIPELFEQINSLPRTASGKLQREKLRR